MDIVQQYDPSLAHQSQNTLYANHFRFLLERYPDLTFYVQSVQLPSLSNNGAVQPNPFTTLAHPSDKLTFGHLQVSFLVDGGFKNYFSLYAWMRGLGFPTAFTETSEYRTHTATQIGNVRPLVTTLEKTNGTLLVLLPDTATVVAECQIHNLWPTELSSLSFSTTDTDSMPLVATATFSCSHLTIKLS